MAVRHFLAFFICYRRSQRPHHQAKSILPALAYRTVLKYREKDMTNTLQQACGIVDYQMYACQQMMNYFVYNQDVINFLECDPTKKTQRYELYQEVSNTISALKYQNLIMESVTIYSEGIRQSFGNETHPLKDLYKESWYRDGIRDKMCIRDSDHAWTAANYLLY